MSRWLARQYGRLSLTPARLESRRSGVLSSFAAPQVFQASVPFSRTRSCSWFAMGSHHNARRRPTRRGGESSEPASPNPGYAPRESLSVDRHRGDTRSSSKPTRCPAEITLPAHSPLDRARLRTYPSLTTSMSRPCHGMQVHDRTVHHSETDLLRINVLAPSGTGRNDGNAFDSR